MLLLKVRTTPDHLSLADGDAETFDLEHVNRSAAAGNMHIAQCPTTFRYVVYGRRFIACRLVASRRSVLLGRVSTLYSLRFSQVPTVS